ncbi:MAG TPA: DUF2796 domain-containing protein [Herbaspirillum sp.]|nr:DUF2796 domain-containing protein [Herbaspirillum sp.]
MKCNRFSSVSFSIILAAGISALCAMTPASAHEAHVHGVGNLDVALDNHTLTLHLDTPLINLLGFEHAANSAPDQQAAQKMGLQLHMANSVFVITPAAQCVQASVTLVSAALKPALLGETSLAAKDTQTAADKHDGHADLDGDFVFSCAHPEQIKAIDVKLFDLYPGFHQINVQAVTLKGQSAATLKAGATSIPF